MNSSACLASAAAVAAVFFANVTYAEAIPERLQSDAAIGSAAEAVRGQQRVSMFSLADAFSGKQRRLSDFYSNHRFVLFFFCGCSACHALATDWARLQRSGILVNASGGSPASTTEITTVVVFSGNAEAAHAFTSQTGLDLAQTAMLIDPEMTVTERLYHASNCPQAFVVEPPGHAPATAKERIAKAEPVDARIVTTAAVADNSPGVVGENDAACLAQLLIAMRQQNDRSMAAAASTAKARSAANKMTPPRRISHRRRVPARRALARGQGRPTD